MSINIHPVYDLYAADENGDVMNTIDKIPLKGDKSYNGYMKCLVRKSGQTLRIYYVHRFVWECFNGSIPRGKVIDHINDIKDDNRLSNLQLMTRKQNGQKSAKNRDYSYVVNNHINKTFVKATDCSTGEVFHYDSMIDVQQNLGINVGIVEIVCKSLNRCKTGISKKKTDEGIILNMWTKKIFLRIISNHQKQGKRQRLLSDEEKWPNRTYVSERCQKIMKNRNKNYHKQNCKDSN